MPSLLEHVLSVGNVSSLLEHVLCWNTFSLLEHVLSVGACSLCWSMFSLLEHVLSVGNTFSLLKHALSVGACPLCWNTCSLLEHALSVGTCCMLEHVLSVGACSRTNLLWGSNLPRYTRLNFPFGPSQMARVGQNHIYNIYTAYIQYFWQGKHQIYGHIRCIYTVLANPTNDA